MNKTLKYISAGAILAMIASCDMDLVPKGSISYNPGDQIITNQSDLTAYRANVLACFRSLDYGDFDIVSDVMADYFNAASDFGNNYGPVHRTDNTFTTGDYNTEDNWEYPYSYIKNFNIFIEGAKVVPAELKAQADVARGEAFLARAFAYMHLARHFGKAYSPETASSDLCVPLVTVYDQSERPARATVAQVYGQIKSDLDSAAVLLAGVPGEVRSQYPTIDAVNFMYARYYLDTRDYQRAAEYATGVINTGTYALSSTAEEMTAEWLDDEGTEPVMQFYASISEGQGGHSAYTGMAVTDGVTHYHPYFIPSQKLIDAYDEGDIRFAQWFDGGDYPSYHNATWYNKDETDYYVFKKYFGNPDLYSSAAPNSAQAVKPFLISEMYLIAAEAYLEAGNGANALTYLNALQEKRHATLSLTATEENIHNEWYRETVGEGLRFSCLKRWGEGFSGRPAQPGAEMVVNTGTAYTEKVFASDDYHFQWPIPTYEMQTNLNLVQNEGYGATVVE